jgi:hypothetical protein
MEEDYTNTQDNTDLLDLPNLYDSFVNNFQDENTIFESDFSEKEIKIQDEYPQVKTLYSNESVSFKYNYIINKFI